MTNHELQELSMLLGKYQNEMLQNDTENKKKILEAEKTNAKRWEVDVKGGVKSQFAHARIIKNRIDVELEKQISLY